VTVEPCASHDFPPIPPVPANGDTYIRSGGGPPHRRSVLHDPFDFAQSLLGKFDVRGRCRLVQLLRPPRTDNGDVHRRVGEHPGNRELGHVDPFVLGNDFQPLHDAQVALKDAPTIGFTVLLIVAGVCGALGQAISGYSRGGCLFSIAIGFIGALVGLWIARTLRLPEIFTLRVGAGAFPFIWSIIGSAFFVAVVSLFARRRR
jgi:uncharacterized membrane protein YeaQ/YmgE (transglycosylase-associated protein family)